MRILLMFVLVCVLFVCSCPAGEEEAGTAQPAGTSDNDGLMDDE